MAMFLQSRLNFNDSEAFSYKHVTCITKRALFTKKGLLLFLKIRLKKVPQKSIFLYSKTEICANQEQTMDGQSLTFL